MLHAQKIFIKFGNSCNLKCSYCLHHTAIEHMNYSYNRDIIDWLNSNEVQPIDNHKIRIILIGGEPLLYIKEIYDIIQNIDNNKFEITVITNGTLLNLENIKYFNDNNCRIVISWDGPSSDKTRGYDVIKEKYNEIQYINNIKISSLLTNDSLLLDKFPIINQVIKNRIKKSLFNMNLDIKVTYHYCYNENSIINIRNEIDTLIRKYNSNALNPIFSEYNFIRNTYNRNMTPIEYTCGSNLVDYSITSDGKFLVCASDIEETNLSIYDNPPEPLKNRYADSCSRCNVKRFCIRPCYFATDDTIKSYCKFSNALYERFI